MGKRLQDVLDGWGQGAITTLEPDMIPKDASPRILNGELSFAAGGKAVIRKRKGIEAILASPLEAAAVIGQHEFRPQTDGVFTPFHIAVTDAGNLYAISGGTPTLLDSSLDPNAFAPDFETATNLCFMVNGTDALKVTKAGNATQNFGITRPAAAPTISAGTGSMTGTYDVAISYYNSVTGHESSRSDESTITLSGQGLTITIPSVTDPQVDVVRVHIRKQSLSAYFFKVSTGTGYNTTTGGWAEGYGSLTLDLSDSTLNAFVILSPDDSENDPPPSGVRFLCWHNARMFAADDSQLYYSKIGKPEAFDPDLFEKINPNDGQVITGLHSVGGILVIFKSRSIWGLYGDDPNSWYLRKIDADIGCTSHRSIVTAEGRTYWWSEQGPVVWVEGDNAFPIGKELIQSTILFSSLDAEQFSEVLAAADRTRQRILFAVRELGETQNNVILPYSYRLSRWESTKWDPMDTCSMAEVVDDTGNWAVSLGNYAGELFLMSKGDVDGIDTGTLAGTFVASGTSMTTITDVNASFATNLVERRVTVVDSTGVHVGRGRITTNTGTSFTLAAAITGLTSGETYAYYLGGPDFQFDTYWGTFDLPFYKKRFEFLFVEADAADSTNLAIDMAFNFDPDQGQTQLQSLTGADGTWNAPIWTGADYGTLTRVSKRIRIGRTGRAWKVRVRQPAANAPVTLLKLGVQAELMSTKS